MTGGREAIARLALIAIAVAIGAGLLLTTIASLNAVHTQNDRYAWLETGFVAQAAQSESTTDPLWWELQPDYYQGQLIGRVDLAATGPDSPIPPGIKALPEAGEFYASPALAELLAATPADQLGDRYPGKQIGTIGATGLPSPDSLIIIIGHSAADLSQSGHARQVSSISTTTPAECDGGCAALVGIDSNGITLILSVVAVTLLFPVLIFIGGATRLSAARREQRFAAMRLIGATPRQISVISTVESCIAAAAGVLLGLGLFYAFRPMLASIPFTGTTFYTSDLSLTVTDIALTVIGIPAAAAIASRIALRRVNISPLGVTRRATPRPPRAWRVIPLIIGIAALGYFAYFTDIGASKDTGAQVAAYLSSILVIMAGLVIAGPWVTMVGARLMARRAQRPANLIAGRRLADNPQAGFRAISGLVIALFVGSLIIGVISTIVSNNAAGAADKIGSTASAGTLVYRFSSADPDALATSVPPALLDDLAGIPGATGVSVLRRVASAQPGPGTSVVSCAQLAGTPAFGRCPAGAETVKIDTNYGGAVVEQGSTMADTVWPDAGLSVSQLQSLPISTIAVGTDGTSAAVERARTILTLEFRENTAFPPQTLEEFKARASKMLNDYQQLANVVLLMSLPIAGCSLAVSVAGGLADRKRPFSLLRLTGTPLALLRRIVALEAVVPLLLSALIAASAGFLTAFLFLRAQMGQTLQPPGTSYYLLVGVGVVISLAVIASTLPLLKRMTGPETARND
ncbi:FtsX-like permease family protein [Antricoccus suffuscus]|nr:FtsX-like permease family protein [Antricoccus suffuscus]